MNIEISKFQEWLINKNLKPRTLQGYSYYLQRFNFREFNQRAVNDFLSLKGNRNSVARSFLLNFQKFLSVNWEALGLTQEQRSKVLEVELPKITGRTKQRMIRVIEHDQIHLLESCLSTEKEKLQLLISYYGGLRLQEMLRITVMSFNWEIWKRDMEKMGEIRVYGKGDKEGIALIPSFLMKRIASYIHSHNFTSVNHYLFLNNNKSKVSLRSASRSWQLALSQAGIKAGITQLDHEGKVIRQTAVHPHKLRHSWATHLLNDKNMDIREVQEVLRHTSIQSTQIYTHINKEKLKEKLSL